MNDLFVAVHPVVDLRVSPSPAAELYTQARFGDLAEVRDRHTGRVQVRLLRSGDSGWADAVAFRRVQTAARPRPIAVVRSLFCNIHSAPSVRAPLQMTAPLGARVIGLGQVRTDAGGAPWAKVELPGGRTAFALDGDLVAAGRGWRWRTSAQLRAGLVRESLRLLGLPYRWGGTTPFGLDCSGLVQLVFGLHGIALSHNARRLAEDPRMRPVTRRAIRSGDLLFFADFKHVGMAISNRDFIHATTWGMPGVQVSRIDDPRWARRRGLVRRVAA